MTRKFLGYIIKVTDGKDCGSGYFRGFDDEDSWSKSQSDAQRFSSLRKSYFAAGRIDYILSGPCYVVKLFSKKRDYVIICYDSKCGLCYLRSACRVPVVTHSQKEAKRFTRDEALIHLGKMKIYNKDLHPKIKRIV